MSSPTSSSTHSGKRKRPSHTDANFHMMDPTLQPSSRDASAEEGDTTAPETEKHQTRKLDLAASSSSVHPPKRQRANSDRAHVESRIDPGEPSDTTEASVDIAERVGRRGRKSSLVTRDENGTADKQATMAPPPIGNLSDPTGYKTNPPPVGRPVRVYADGVFDLFHLGHMRQLEQAKKAFPDVYLMVGVTGDEDTHRRKGLTVLSGAERAETVRHCKWVDEVVENCPWIVTPEFLDEHQIDYVAHDDIPYGADEGDDIYGPIKEAGKFLATQRTEGVSTTGIITRVVRDYEKYLARQFKRGASRQELNVSWLKKNEMDLKRHVQDLRENITNNWTTTGQELGRELKQFWPTSRPQSPARFNSAGSAEQLRSPTTPGGGSGTPKEFITGYALGLVGGVRSWMTKSRRDAADGSRPVSDDESEESDTIANANANANANAKTSTDPAINTPTTTSKL